MSNLFVSVEYVGRYKDIYDKSFYSGILHDRVEPKDQEELEALQEHLRQELIDIKQLDAVSLVILYFKSV